MTIETQRDALVGVSDLFVERWSPRAFRNGAVDETTLSRIFEAARWAPSCFNDQPWTFYTSTADDFEDYIALLNDSNQQWAKNASVIGFLIGRKHFSHNGKPNSSYQLDCGAAWMSLALQARIEGLYTHGMAGIKHQAIQEYLQLDPAGDEILMGFALGYMGDKNDLNETLREREKPSGRKSLAEIWHHK